MRLLLSVAVSLVVSAAPAAASDGNDHSSWSGPVTISGAGGASHPAVAVAGDGTAVATWRESVGGSDYVRAALRPPGGGFGPTATLGTVDGSDPAVAAGGGDAVVAWTSGGHVLAAVAHGGSFGQPAVVGDGSGPAQAAMGEDGAAVVTFVDGASIAAALRAPGADFGAAEVAADGLPAGFDLKRRAVALRSAGAAVFAWEQPAGAGRAESLWSERSADGSYSAPERLGPGGSDSVDPQLDANASGQIAMAWTEAAPGARAGDIAWRTDAPYAGRADSGHASDTDTHSPYGSTGPRRDPHVALSNGGRLAVTYIRADPNGDGARGFPYIFDGVGAQALHPASDCGSFNDTVADDVPVAAGSADDIGFAWIPLNGPPWIAAALDRTLDGWLPGFGRYVGVNLEQSAEPAIAVGPGGSGVLVYTDVTDGKIKVSYGAPEQRWFCSTANDPYWRPQNVTPARMTGTPRPGSRLTAQPGQWRSLSPIHTSRHFMFREPSGRTFDAPGTDWNSSEESYVVRPQDVGKTILLFEGAKDDWGSASTSSPALVIQPAPTVEALPKIVRIRRAGKRKVTVKLACGPARCRGRMSLALRSRPHAARRTRTLGAHRYDVRRAAARSLHVTLRRRFTGRRIRVTLVARGGKLRRTATVAVTHARRG
jgi:hypothetical protein